jgi:nicotinamidase-related amidase
VKYLAGKPIPMTFEELVDPAHTALLVIDVQKEFCEESGIFPKRGVIIPSVKKTIDNIAQVLKAARESRIKVVFVQQTTLPGRQSDSSSWTRFMLKTFNVENPDDIPEFCLDGSWGHQVVDELRPKNGEFVVKKHRSSAFIATDLDFVLRNNGIKTLVTTGVTTEGCVESTARDGQLHDYNIVTLRDCVNSENQKNHEAMLEIMTGRWDVISSKQLLEIWSSRGPTQLIASRRRRRLGDKKTIIR